MLLDAEVLDIVGEVVLVVVTGKLLLMVVDIGPEADMGVVVRFIIFSQTNLPNLWLSSIIGKLCVLRR